MDYYKDNKIRIVDMENNSKEKFNKAFTSIYEDNIWNELDNYTSNSGDGSDLNYNIYTFIPFLKDFILKNNIHSVTDLGCGDFVCGPHIYDDLNIKYYGYDTYSKIIEKNNSIHKDSKYSFKHLDIFNEWENIYPTDLCIIKDVLQHWRLADIYTFLDNIMISKKFKYIIICNCCDQIKDNPDLLITGGFRPLSASFFPLKRYSAKIIFRYNTKEVSLITFH
jgi:hypothetical protein